MMSFSRFAVSLLPSLEVLVSLAGLILMIPMSATTSLPMAALPAERRIFSARARASVAAAASISSFSSPSRV